MALRISRRVEPTLWQLLADLDNGSTSLRDTHRTIRARERAALRRRTTQRKKESKT